MLNINGLKKGDNPKFIKIYINKGIAKDPADAAAKHIPNPNFRTLVG
jgi:hypothetical protein